MKTYLQPTYPKLQNMIDSCLYTSTGNVAGALLSNFDLTTLSALPQQMNTYTSDVAANPISTTTLDTLTTQATGYSTGSYPPPTPAYDNSLSSTTGSSNQADVAATTLTSWSDSAATGSYQVIVII